MVESVKMLDSLPVQQKPQLLAIPRNVVIRELTKKFNGDKTLAKRSYLRAVFRTLALQNLSVVSADGSVLNLELKDNGMGKLICVALPPSKNVEQMREELNPVIRNPMSAGENMRPLRLDCTTVPQKRPRETSVVSMSPLMGSRSKRVQQRPVNSPREHLRFDEKSRKRTNSSPQSVGIVPSKRSKTSEKQNIALDVLASICTISKS